MGQNSSPVSKFLPSSLGPYFCCFIKNQTTHQPPKHCEENKLTLLREAGCLIQLRCSSVVLLTYPREAYVQGWESAASDRRRKELGKPSFLLSPDSPLLKISYKNDFNLSIREILLGTICTRSFWYYRSTGTPVSRCGVTVNVLQCRHAGWPQYVVKCK